MVATSNIMDGKAVAAQVLNEAVDRVRTIIERTGVTPCLCTVLVGDDPASIQYTRMKRKRCESVGMKSMKVELTAGTTTGQLVEQITGLSDDPAVHGILLQHPVPDQIDERAGFEAIDPAKDVDGVSTKNFGSISFDLGGYGACTPVGMMKLLDHYGVDIEGKQAVVVGRSPIVGKPMAMLLLARHATVTICHSRTRDLPAVVRQAEIVVAAVGKPRFIRGDWIRPEAVVLDSGYNEGNVGDVQYDAAAERASLITPVPGGVGPMTVATLIEQTAVAAGRQLGVA